MRSPSARVLNQRCNIFIAGPGRDAEGGVQFPYPSTPTFPNEPCSIQGRATEIFDEQRRITEYTDYIVIFKRQLPISPRDMIQYTDKAGNLRTIFVSAEWDMAGRGSTFGVPCTERQ
jgi:hypothetical protein